MFSLSFRKKVVLVLETRTWYIEESRLFEAVSRVRQKVTKALLEKFMSELARRTSGPGSVFFTGGSTALLLGLREQTIDIDIKIDPEPRGIFEAIKELKDELDLNIELASPADFIPAPPQWRALATNVGKIRELSYAHYDLAMQALAKIERGFSHDLADAAALISNRYITAEQLRERFAQIQPHMIRYPAIDEQAFTIKLDNFLRSIVKS